MPKSTFVAGVVERREPSHSKEDGLKMKCLPGGSGVLRRLTKLDPVRTRLRHVLWLNAARRKLNFRRLSLSADKG
jgi:hypothetical protein